MKIVRSARRLASLDSRGTCHRRAQGRTHCDACDCQRNRLDVREGLVFVAAGRSLRLVPERKSARVVVTGATPVPVSETDCGLVVAPVSYGKRAVRLPMRKV